MNNIVLALIGLVFLCGGTAMIFLAGWREQFKTTVMEDRVRIYCGEGMENLPTVDWWNDTNSVVGGLTCVATDAVAIGHKVEENK